MNRTMTVAEAEAWVKKAWDDAQKAAWQERDLAPVFERFAALVAAAEREACAKVCDELAEKDRLSNYYAVAARAIRAREEK